MDPVEYRKKIYIKEGETSPVFKAMGEGREGVDQYITSCGLVEALDKGAELIDWKNKHGRGRDIPGPKKRGIGCVGLMQGSGIPEIDMASASIKLNEDGSFNMLIGATDLGTGCDTILSQMVAEVLGVSVNEIIVVASDTDVTPFDVGAYASSTTYISGNAVRKAAEDARRQILNVASEMLKEDLSTLSLSDGKVVAKSGKSCTLAEVGQTTLYLKDQFQILGVGSNIGHSSPPPFSAHFAEVEVDTETGQVKVIKYVACVDCGTAINPQSAEGQVEGAVVNGLSYALTEEMSVSKQGRVMNPNFRKYKIYNTKDLPELVTVLIPTYEPTGPFGAKSVSEVAINGPQPAIANAIYDAVGVRLYDPPFTSEKVLKALKEKR